MNFKKLITSSADPKQFSLTVQGVLISLVPLLMALTGLTEASLNGIVDAVVEATYFATAFVASVHVLVGLLRKVYMKRWSAAE